MVGFVDQGQVKRYIIGLCEQILKTRHLDAKFIGGIPRRVQIAARCNDPQTEALRPLGHRTGGVAEADQAQHAPGKKLIGGGLAARPAPGSCRHRLRHLRQLAKQRQQQRHGMVGLLFDAE